jgi:hypothetical protein
MARTLNRAAAPAAPATSTAPAALEAGMVSKFDNMSAAEIDAMLGTLIAADKDANKRDTGLRAKTNAQIAEISRDLMLAVGRKFQLDPNFSGEDMALRYEGKEVVDKWRDSTKSARFSEWNAVGDAARKVPQRFNVELWNAAGGKDKFRTVCRAIVKNPAATADELKAIAKAPKPTTDGDYVAQALAILGKVSTDNFAAIVEAVEYLQEVRRDDGRFETTAEAAKRAKSGGTVEAGGGKLTLADKIRLAKATAPGTTTQQ